MKSQYKDVRSLSRGLAILRALNRFPGGQASISELSVQCGVHRTTVKRIIETLRTEGLVRQGEKEGQYYLTFEVCRLSEGFKDESWVSDLAAPLMHQSVKKLLWPSDLGTVEGCFMVIRESTHRWSMLSQHKAMIGEKMPVFVTALGRAWLAAINEDELAEFLRQAQLRTDWIGEFARDSKKVRAMIRETRRRGYGINDGEYISDPMFAAYAVAIRSGSNVVGALNLVFPKSALKEIDFRKKFLPALQTLAAAIGNRYHHYI